jgi:hypothetical protein
VRMQRKVSLWVIVVLVSVVLVLSFIMFSNFYKFPGIYSDDVGLIDDYRVGTPEEPGGGRGYSSNCGGSNWNNIYQARYGACCFEECME